MRLANFLLLIIYSSFGVAAPPLADFEPRGKSVMASEVLHSDELSYRIEKDENAIATFVAFTASWCDECDAVQSLWGELSREFDHYMGVRVVTVDCDGSGKRACALHRIVTLPWLVSYSRKTPLLLGDEANDESARAEAYLGGLERETIRSWMLNQAPRLATAVSFGKLKREPIWASEQIEGSQSQPGGSGGGALCVAWRASRDCDPEGPRDEPHDLSCAQLVLGNRAGYCDCGKGRVEKVSDCGSEGRQAFTCLEECSPAAGCESWRATKGCEAGTARQQKDTAADVGCRKLISSDWSGFCDCGQGLEAGTTNCSHAPFTCAAKCSALRSKLKVEEENTARERAEKRAAKIARQKAAQVISIEEQLAQEAAAEALLEAKRRSVEEAATKARLEAARIEQEAVLAAEAAAEAALKREAEEASKKAEAALKKKKAEEEAERKRQVQKEKARLEADAALKKKKAEAEAEAERKRQVEEKKVELEAEADAQNQPALLSPDEMDDL